MPVKKTIASLRLQFGTPAVPGFSDRRHFSIGNEKGETLANCRSFLPFDTCLTRHIRVKRNCSRMFAPASRQAQHNRQVKVQILRFTASL